MARTRVLRGGSTDERHASRATGINTLDFSRIFAQYDAACVDRVHPEGFINVAGIREMIVKARAGTPEIRALFSRVNVAALDKEIADGKRDFDARRRAIAKFVEVNRIKSKIAARGDTGAESELRNAETELERLAKEAGLSVKSLTMSSSWEV